MKNNNGGCKRQKAGGESVRRWLVAGIFSGIFAGFFGITGFAQFAPPGGMSGDYYNYIRSWQDYRNVSANKMETKNAGVNATATSKYVFADEFNTLTGTLRGWYNALSGSKHSFGLDGAPAPGVTLDTRGAVRLGSLAKPVCNQNFAGSLVLDDGNRHFYYCNGTQWRQLDTPDCNSCSAYEYTCTDDGDGDYEGVWNGGTTACDPVDFDSSGNTAYDDDPTSQIPTTVCSAEDMTTPAVEALCEVRRAGTPTCNKIVDHYETRCDPTANGGNGAIYWYDDCGVKSGVVRGCANGCRDEVWYSACFVAGTEVLMADGSVKPIEQVQVGEKIRGKSGVNTVLGFHRPQLGEKALYAFNDGDYFVTAEHPFWTTDG